MVRKCHFLQCIVVQLYMTIIIYFDFPLILFFADDALKKTFNQAMCSGATRADARYIFDNMLKDPLKVLIKLPSMIYRILKDCY